MRRFSFSLNDNYLELGLDVLNAAGLRYGLAQKTCLVNLVQISSLSKI